MALCQLIPEFTPSVKLGVGTPKPLRRMQGPVSTGFRASGSLSEVVEVVRGGLCVSVDSAACAGKSTRLPLAIATGLKVLVVHVVPSAHLARELFDYLSVGSSEFALILNPVEDFPSAGVAITSAAALQSRFLTAGELRLPECVLYHDESHKSDCWTYLLARQWGTIGGVTKYVTATATAGTSGFRAIETKGQVIKRKYTAAKRDEPWSVFANNGDPWEVASVMGNMLIFEDESVRADALVVAYNSAGMEAFRLHSRMRVERFVAAMQSLRGPALTVLVADSSFRDGYTWPLSKIIDTGRVVYTSVSQDGPARVVRDAYQFEVYQGAARGGRVGGETVEVWQPEVAFEAKRVTLEEVEMEAVALVSRMLSTMVPIDALDAVMAEGLVPRDLVGALNGTMPLAVLRDTQLVPLASGGYERAPSPVLKDDSVATTPGMDFIHRGVTADIANMRDFSVSSHGSSRAPSVATQPSSVSSVITDDDLSKWVEESMGDTVLEMGRYYYSPGVPMDRVECAAFPEGWKSVVRIVSDLPGALNAEAMPVHVRHVAVAAVLQRFNSLSCELNAVGKATADVRKLAVGRSPVLLRQWLRGFLERSTSLQVEIHTIKPIVEMLARGFCSFEQLPEGCLHDQEHGIADTIVDEVRRLPDVELSAGQAADVLRKSIVVPTVVAPKQYVTPPVLKDPEKYVAMACAGRTARPVRRPSASGAFLKWVVGAEYSASAKKLCDKRLGV